MTHQDSGTSKEEGDPVREEVRRRVSVCQSIKRTSRWDRGRPSTPYVKTFWVRLRCKVDWLDCNKNRSRIKEWFYPPFGQRSEENFTSPPKNRETATKTFVSLSHDKNPRLSEGLREDIFHCQILNGETKITVRVGTATSKTVPTYDEPPTEGPLPPRYWRDLKLVEDLKKVFFFLFM